MKNKNWSLCVAAGHLSPLWSQAWRCGTVVRLVARPYGPVQKLAQGDEHHFYGREGAWVRLPTSCSQTPAWALMWDIDRRIDAAYSALWTLYQFCCGEEGTQLKWPNEQSHRYKQPHISAWGWESRSSRKCLNGSQFYGFFIYLSRDNFIKVLKIMYYYYYYYLNRKYTWPYLWYKAVSANSICCSYIGHKMLPKL